MDKDDFEDDDGNEDISFAVHVRLFFAHHATYASLRFSYFTFVGLVGATMIYVLEGRNTSFVDSLFMAFSAVSNTGLTAVDITKWTIGSQVVTLCLIVLGSQVLLTAAPVVIRRKYYRHAYYEQRHVHKGYKNEAEYQALGWMKRLSTAIFLGVQLVAFVILGLYISQVKSSLCEKNHVNPWWFSLFHAISAFNNGGLSLFPDSLVQFQSDHFVLLVTCFLILFGNTAYPVFLRLIVWGLHRRLPNESGLKYLLKFPRKCCTHMFPALHTRILATFVVLFTVTMMVLFVALDNDSVFSTKSQDVHAINGFFQAISTRTAGFNTVDITGLAPSMQVTYCVMMYVASYPIISAIRNISEVLSVDDEAQTAKETETTIEPNTVVFHDLKSTTQQMKQSILADSWLLVLALFVICVAEDKPIRDKVALDVFSILFEISSAYGTVGLSLSLPNTSTSLSGAFSTTSKVTMMIVMLMGRNRGLPRAIDASVSLPFLLNVKGSKSRSFAERLRAASPRFRVAASPRLRIIISPKNESEVELQDVQPIIRTHSLGSHNSFDLQTSTDVGASSAVFPPSNEPQNPPTSKQSPKDEVHGEVTGGSLASANSRSLPTFSAVTKVHTPQKPKQQQTDEQQQHHPHQQQQQQHDDVLDAEDAITPQNTQQPRTQDVAVISEDL